MILGQDWSIPAGAVISTLQLRRTFITGLQPVTEQVISGAHKPTSTHGLMYT